ncbi:MAG: hypothetical protein HYX29_08505 [Solirubrobacterales bacterium]|nr:hypothetical protein [Solirubrobacterales bacterium]
MISSAVALLIGVGVANAEAATYGYCSGCTINGNGGSVTAGISRYITSNYVHRLSGPSGGVTIGARAFYTDNGSWGNFVYSTSTEVTHGYSGSRPARGSASNFGAGNYGFNAHVLY